MRVSSVPALVAIAFLGCGRNSERMAVACARGKEDACRTLEQRCGQGEPEACLLAGRALGWRIGPGDEKRALVVNGAACNAGIATACVRVAENYWRGGVVVISGREAVRFLERACSLGDRFACASRRAQYPSAGFPDSASLVKWEQLCDRGEASRCVSLGYMLARAEGVALDIEKGFALIARACDAGNGEGCYFMAGMFSGWYGHEWQLPKVDGFLLKGCDLGEPRACEVLGNRLLEGLQREDGTAFLQRACQAGSSHVCNQLAIIRSSESGTPVAVEIRNLLERSCRGTPPTDDPMNCLDLADHLRAARAPTAEWKSLYEEACDHGSRYACEQYWRTVDPAFGS